MKRKIYKELLKWKSGGMGKPLMVVGARQIGKTYTIDEFCRNEFCDYLYINLPDRQDIIGLFREQISMDERIEKLQLIIGRKIDFKSTVIFFDEIQESEEIISALKYFAESSVSYKIICAGSLLGVKIKRFKSSFPVGKVKLIDMFPLDFEEFALALGEDGLVAEIRRCYVNDNEMIAPLHRKCLNLFRMYLCIGGMPEAVNCFMGTNADVLSFDRSIVSDIVRAYIADMSKYIETPLESSRIESIYRSIPAQLGNSNKKFQYSKIRQGARSRHYASALDWLVSSSMVYKCEMVDPPQMPLAGFATDGYFKLFVSDTGILCSVLDIRFPEIMLDAEFSYKGILTENYVACQFAAIGIPLYYWKSDNKAEVDFLIDTHDGIIPIEVKSGQNKYSASLKSYSDRFHPKYTIKITARNFGFFNDIKTIPLYAVFCLSPEW